MASLTQHSLPVLEFTKNNCTSSSWAITRAEAVRSLEDYGCFVAIYDQVSRELQEAIFGEAQELFHLPREAKVLNTSNLPSHGYQGQIPHMPLYESFGIENPTSAEGVQKFSHTLWPNGNPNFSDIVLSYSRIAAELDRMVMRMVSETYGIEKECESLLGSVAYLLRILKYKGPGENVQESGGPPHTDKNFLTILHQNKINGLEIETKDGEWMPFHSSPSSFIVMAGDALTAWTNGRIKAPRHRVTMAGKEDRYSLGLFDFVWDSTIEVPEALVDEEHPLLYKPFDLYKFFDYGHTLEGMKSGCCIK